MQSYHGKVRSKRSRLQGEAAHETSGGNNDVAAAPSSKLSLLNHSWPGIPKKLPSTVSGGCGVAGGSLKGAGECSIPTFFPNALMRPSPRSSHDCPSSLIALTDTFLRRRMPAAMQVRSDVQN